MDPSEALITAAKVGMHARFPEAYVHLRDREVTITCDMLQFWLRDEPLDDRNYEFTLSFLRKEVQEWARLAAEQNIEHFNIEFHPAAVLREVALALPNREYVAAHPPRGIQQLVSDLEELLGLAKEAGRVRQDGVNSAVATGHRQAAFDVMCKGWISSSIMV